MELKGIFDYVIKNPTRWIHNTMQDEDNPKSQEMIQLSDLPESIQQDIRVILNYIALQVAIEDDEDESNHETKGRNSD